MAKTKDTSSDFHDPDERVVLPIEAKEALRALLAVKPDEPETEQK